MAFCVTVLLVSGPPGLSSSDQGVLVPSKFRTHGNVWFYLLTCTCYNSIISSSGSIYLDTYCRRESWQMTRWGNPVMLPLRGLACRCCRSHSCCCWQCCHSYSAGGWSLGHILVVTRCWCSDCNLLENNRVLIILEKSVVVLTRGLRILQYQDQQDKHRDSELTEVRGPGALKVGDGWRLLVQFLVKWVEPLKKQSSHLSASSRLSCVPTAVLCSTSTYLVLSLRRWRPAVRWKSWLPSCRGRRCCLGTGSGCGSWERCRGLQRCPLLASGWFPAHRDGWNVQTPRSVCVHSLLQWCVIN